MELTFHSSINKSMYLGPYVIYLIGVGSEECLNEGSKGKGGGSPY